jgi:hypothetical protein
MLCGMAVEAQLAATAHEGVNPPKFQTGAALIPLESTENK